EVNPARLVFWGGSSGAPGTLANVYLKLAPDYPCGLRVPQISGRVCDRPDLFSTFGHRVSVARGRDGGYCALIATATDARSTEPDGLTSWKSDDGATWTPASPPNVPPVELEGTATLVGASVTWDADRFHVAVARRAGDVRLSLAAASTCGVWGAL